MQYLVTGEWVEDPTVSAEECWRFGSIGPSVSYYDMLTFFIGLPDNLCYKYILILKINLSFLGYSLV
jgi:hypothetical protein